MGSHGNSVNVEMPLLLPFFLVLPFCLSNPVSSEHSGLKETVKDDLEETMYKNENLDDIENKVEELQRKLETKNVNEENLQKQLKEMSNANSSSSSCPSGWWAGPAGLGCVLLQTEELTWEEAAENCWTNYKAHLVEIKNEEQQDFLRTILGLFPDDDVYGWWIGATDLNREGSWYWAHSLESMEYSGWFPGEPNNYLGDENCALIWSNEVPNRKSFWNDYHCSYDSYSICQQTL